MLILAGSYGINLAQGLRKWKKADKGEYRQEIFKNGERRIKILSPVEGQEVLVVQDMARDAEAALMEILLIVDALKEARAKKVILVIPFLAYSFQNREFKGEPVSVRVIAKMLSVSGADEVILVDLHEPMSAKYFSIPVKNVSVVELFAESILELELKGDVCVVAPDKGSTRRVDELGKLTGWPTVQMSKVRNLQTLEIEGLKIEKGKLNDTCILIDDAVNSGRTIVEVSDWLRKKGVKQIIWCVTHFMGVEGSLELIMPKIDFLITTNSCAHGLKESRKVKILELKW